MRKMVHSVVAFLLVGVGSGIAAPTASASSWSYTAKMSAAQVISNPGDAGATGNARITFRTGSGGTVCYKVSYTNVSPPDDVTLSVGKAKRGQTEDPCCYSAIDASASTFVNGARNCVHWPYIQIMKAIARWADRRAAYLWLYHCGNPCGRGAIRGQLRPV